MPANHSITNVLSPNLCPSVRILITYILINCEWFIIKLCGIGIILLTDLLCGITSYYFSVDLRFNCIFKQINKSYFSFQLFIEIIILTFSEFLGWKSCKRMKDMKLVWTFIHFLTICTGEFKFGMIIDHYHFSLFTQRCLMILTEIFKVIDIGYDTFSAH